MIDWVLQNSWWVAAASLLLSVGGLVLATTLLLLLPPDYFLPDKRQPLLHSHRHPLIRLLILIFKNLLGALALLLGLVMALPLMPGPGILFILVGVSLLNFPGKYRLERAIIGQKKILRSINAIRGRWKRPPFILTTTNDFTQPTRTAG